MRNGVFYLRPPSPPAARLHPASHPSASNTGTLARRMMPSATLPISRCIKPENHGCPSRSVRPVLFLLHRPIPRPFCRPNFPAARRCMANQRLNGFACLIQHRLAGSLDILLQLGSIQKLRATPAKLGRSTTWASSSVAPVCWASLMVLIQRGAKYCYRPPGQKSVDT